MASILDSIKGRLSSYSGAASQPVGVEQNAATDTEGGGGAAPSPSAQQEYDDAVAAARATYDQTMRALDEAGLRDTDLGHEVEADMARRREEAIAAARQDYYNRLGEEARGVPGDPATDERAAEIGDLRTREIDRGAADATRGIAQSYSRRGIGGSGYAAGTQSQAIQLAADERNRARAAALDQAVAEGQRGIMLQAQTASMGDPFLMTLLMQAEQRYRDELARQQAEEEWFRDQMMSLVMSGAGYAAGSFAGGGGAGGGSVPGLNTAGGNPANGYYT